MKERPILFSGPMVRALLAGTKTQTRRVVKPPRGYHWLDMAAGTMINAGGHKMHRSDLTAPYGVPGDRLGVRETWMPDPPRDGTWPHVAFDGCKPRDMSLIPEPYRTSAYCLYRADGHDSLSGWTPAIHMFRWASRITLEITAVRVERLQDISEADCRAEGITDGGCTTCGMPEPCGCAAPAPDAREAYCQLWQQLNGADSWAADPWVWGIEFKVMP